MVVPDPTVAQGPIKTPEASRAATEPVMVPVVLLLKLIVPPVLRPIVFKASVFPLEALIVEAPELTDRPVTVCVLLATVGA